MVHSKYQEYKSLHLYSAKTETWLRKGVYLYMCASTQTSYWVSNYTSKSVDILAGLGKRLVLLW